MAKTKNNGKNGEFELQNAIDEIAEKTSVIIEHYQNQSVDKRTSLGRQVKALETSLQALQESCTADATMMCSLNFDKSLKDIRLSIRKEIDEMTDQIKNKIISKMSMNRALKDKKNLLALVNTIIEDNAKFQKLLIECGAVVVRGNKN